MDAFYASVEQRDNPSLRGKPVIVGGNPNSRGVVSTCSYEARKFGVHSAMASSRAYKLCPHGIFVQPRFEAYKEASSRIMDIFLEYSDIVEPLSLDEAFLDVTENKKGIDSAITIAKEILEKIYINLQLTASAGISYNKFLAKVASDYNKPNGITVVRPENANRFIDDLPVRKFFGVGRVTEKKMTTLGIKTGKDIKRFSKDKFISFFGKAGNYFYDCAYGIDNRSVGRSGVRKSIGKETTLREDIINLNQIIKILEEIAIKIEKILTSREVKGLTITLKVKYFDFQSVTRSITLQEPVDKSSTIMKHIRLLLKKTEAGLRKIRLLGISISNFPDEKFFELKYKQMYLPFRDDFF